MSYLAAPVANRVYDFYGRFYDLFQMLFKRRLGRAIAALPLPPGSRVLDIGVGTGLSLEFYPANLRVTGIDLSAGMLRQAQRKLGAGHLRSRTPRNHIQLLQADALHLPFRDASFDAIILSHVISTVTDPQRCLSEALRVARDHATIALVNHFRSRYPAMNWLESAIDPFCRRLGWRCDLSLNELLACVNVPRHASSSGNLFFQTIYLQKLRNTVRVVRLSPVERRHARLRPA
jgi:phosphatidylethanolamine/phosphatidyl-N-methylethanolamine N-methyltransferase